MIGCQGVRCEEHDTTGSKAAVHRRWEVAVARAVRVDGRVARCPRALASTTARQPALCDRRGAHVPLCTRLARECGVPASGVERGQRRRYTYTLVGAVPHRERAN